MSENMFVWEVSVSKKDSDEVFEKLYFVGVNYFQVSHISAFYIYGDGENRGMYNDFVVEVTEVKRVKGIGRIVNGEDFMDEEGDESEMIDPFDISGQPEDDLIIFKHTCDEKLKLTDSGWGWVKCPKCKDTILRNEIQNLNGIWVFIKNENRRK